MKRDMNLIRKILFEIEKSPSFSGFIDLKIRDYTDEEISYHVLLLSEANLIVALDMSTYGNTDYKPVRLTWSGHEFLEAAKDDTRWKKAVDTVINKGGGVVFDILKDVLISLAREAILGKI